MPFSTKPELRSLASLHGALAPLGYSISQKARVIDVIKAASEVPDVTTPVGPSLADWWFPAIRALAGPLRPDHPWLQPGDWRYAFSSHFDFVVHAPLGERHATQPLFAVEFDGPTHRRREARERDCRKNRLCAASGLPLVRIDDTFLVSRDHLVLVRWLAELWAAHRREMPTLIAQRDAALASMSDEEKEREGAFLLMEHPDLDVDFLFRLAHPYPPTAALAARLGRRHRFAWSYVQSSKVPDPRWRVDRWMYPLPVLDAGLDERWSCKLRIRGQDGASAEIKGAYEMRGAYPIDVDEEEVVGGWMSFFEGVLPFMPAGPWMGATSLVAEALCLHNTLVEIEDWLNHNDQPRAARG